MAEKILVLASGGLDSSVVVALYKNLGYDVHILYIKYRNKNWDIEITKILGLMDKLDIPQSNFKTSSILLPWSNSSCIQNSTSDPANQYVEARNLVFASLAVSCAEALGINIVAMGILCPHIDYPDTYPEFLDTLDKLSSQFGVYVEAPLRQLDKDGVYKLALKLGLTLDDTHSCNLGDKPCGECLDCKLVEEFKNGV